MKPKIRIATPHYWPLEYGGISQPTMDCINKIRGSGYFKTDFRHQRGTIICNARNELITIKALVHQDDFEFDYLLFIDADNYVDDPIIELQKMLACDKPVVSGAYKGENDLYICGLWDDIPGLISPVSDHYLSVFREHFQKLQYCGMGFCLIKAEVFSTLEYPYFASPPLKISDSPKQACMVGSDVYFCMQCEKAGIPIYVDFSIQVHHLKQWKPKMDTTPIKKEEKTKTQKDLTKEELAYEILIRQDKIELIKNEITELRRELVSR